MSDTQPPDGEMKPLSNLIPLAPMRNRKIRRAIAKAMPAPESTEVGRKLCSMTQLVYALVLERDNPDEPIEFSKEDLVTLNPRDVVVKIEGDRVRVWLATPSV